MEDQGWYECRVLFLDQHSPEEDFANGSWVHLTVNCMKLGSRWWRWEGRRMMGTLDDVRGGGGNSVSIPHAALVLHRTLTLLVCSLSGYILPLPSFLHFQFFKSKSNQSLKLNIRNLHFLFLLYASLARIVDPGEDSIRS